MIEILNDLPPMCEDCPRLKLKPSEFLCSGKVAFTCTEIRDCQNMYSLGYRDALEGKKDQSSRHI